MPVLAEYMSLYSCAYPFVFPKESLDRSTKATDLKPCSARLWCEQIGLFKLAHIPADTGKESSFDCRKLEYMMESAFASVPKSEHAMIWKQGLEVSISMPGALEWIQAELSEAFIACTYDVERHALVPVVCALLETLW